MTYAFQFDEMIPMYSILVTSDGEAVQAWWYVQREVMNLFPGGEICWPVDLSYA